MAVNQAICSRRDVRLTSLGLNGVLSLSESSKALVVFAHGSGSSRLSPRNAMVAERLNAAGVATLLFDLLSEEESRDRRNVFDIALLADRLVEAIHWARKDVQTGRLPIGLFGASTGAAAVLCAAARESAVVRAVVSRGGRPDLAPPVILRRVRAPTLLIVGERDVDVLALNRSVLRSLDCETSLKVVSGATHLFEEPGALEEAAALARDWFVRRLVGQPV